MSIINVRDNENNMKEKRTYTHKKNKDKRTRGTKATVKGLELNGFVAPLS